MKLVYFLQSEPLDVYFNPATKMGYIRWKAWASEETYMRAMDIQLKMILETKLETLVCDIRDFKGTTANAQKYTTDEILPKIYNAARLKKIAYIVGESAFANFTLTVIRKDIAKKNETLTTNAFMNTEDAEQWLNKP